MPLLNTCLSESRTVVAKRNMPVMVLIVVSFMVISPTASSAENLAKESQGGIKDVFFLDLPCDVILHVRFQGQSIWLNILEQIGVNHAKP